MKRGIDLVSSVTMKCSVSLRRLAREELEMSLSWKEMVTVDTESPVTLVKNGSHVSTPSASPQNAEKAQQCQDKDLAPVAEKAVCTRGARRRVARTCSENGAHGFVLDELVWAKDKDVSWWPALVVQWTDGNAPAHMRRVERLGDDTFSEIHTDGLLPFSDFAKCFCFVSYAGLSKYQTAIYQALELAGERCKKSFSSASGSKEEGMRSMLAWAFGGFQPTGPAGFMTIPDDEETAEVDSESDSPAEVDCDSDSSESDFEPPSKRRKRSTQRTITTKPQNLEVDLDSDSSETDFEPPSKRRKQPTQTTITTQPKNRGHILAELAERSIESFCISCGSYEPEVEHPLFEGGLCERCKTNFAETLYTFDEDGSQSYCTVCCWGHEVVLCSNASCTRSFCKDCLEFLVGEGTFERMKEVEPWSCYMCEPVEESGALRLRPDWSTRVQHFFANSSGLHFDPHRVYPAIPAPQQRPIRVLSLFDGIATGYLVLKELGFQIELYVAAEICRDSVAVGAIQHERQIKYIRDVRSITRKHLAEWGQFDLLIGGSPCNDLCTVNPHRKGLFEGTGRLFFEYYRMLTMLMPREDEDRPFFFLFENVVRMSNNDKSDISRFLECNPVMLDAVSVSPAHRARYFWGNLPGMNRRLVPTHNDRVNLQDCLEPGRTAKCAKLKTITTRFPIRGKTAGMTPVIMDGEDDCLWSTELERVFGFPKHYTDVANMNRAQRQEILGKSWSVPVIRHLLSPLKDYFLCN
ncbi:DNA (cytosine-5)-methyltransferase 3B-like [Engraulis encrasicolus]|uniref:DNA (cytosine-5)-methyltransferase 3B-like n=1 Tax=Engraulis encrasicolus TaxID=184585 RepID=UPI002FD0C3AA